MLNSRKKAVKSCDMKRLARYRHDLCDHPRLTHLFLELTESCNLNCAHCGTPRTGGKVAYLDESLAVKAVDALADDFPESSAMLCLTGGEPLLYPGFFRLANYARERGVPWGLTTNGTLIRPETAQSLMQAGMGSVSVSLDGLEDEHDGLRGAAGCYAAAIRGIKCLLDVGMPVQVTTVVHSGNISQLEEIFELVVEVGAYSWRLVNIEPIGNALLHEELMLSSEQCTQLLDFIRSKRYSGCGIEVTYGCSHYLSYEYEREVRDNYFICGAGVYVASILVNGDIYACLDIERRPELVQGNLRVDDLREVWKNGFHPFRVDRSATSTTCMKCPESLFCKGDSAHTWDFDNCEPRLCLLTGKERG